VKVIDGAKPVLEDEAPEEESLWWGSACRVVQVGCRRPAAASQPDQEFSSGQARLRTPFHPFHLAAHETEVAFIRRKNCIPQSSIAKLELVPPA
jgi:hypothetical protein